MQRNFEEALRGLRTVAEEAIGAPDLTRIAENTRRTARGQGDSLRFSLGVAAVVVLLSLVVLGQRALAPSHQVPGLSRRYPRAHWLPGGQPSAPLAPPAVSQPPGLGRYALVPVVTVPTTLPKGVSEPVLYPLPRRTYVWAPPSSAGVLAAYGVKLGPSGYGRIIYLVGPRGMAGTAKVAGDGALRITLSSPAVRIDVRSEPTCVRCAAEIGAPYFAQARRAAIGYGGYKGSTISELPIAVRSVYHGLIVYGYQNPRGGAVYGLAHYGMAYTGNGGRLYLVTVEMQPDDAQMAGYILSGALAAFGPPSK